MANQHVKLSLLIVVALPTVELEAVKNYVIDNAANLGLEPLSKLDFEEHLRNDPFFVATYFMKVGGHARHVGITFLKEMGNWNSGIETVLRLENNKPDRIAVVGIAGSLRPSKAKLGDVIIGTAVQWLVLNKLSVADPPFAPFNSDVRYKWIHPFSQSDDRKADVTLLLGRLSESLPSNQPAGNDTLRALCALPGAGVPDLHKNEVRAGEILSWEYVLNWEQLRDQLARHRSEALCVEMESGGIYYAIRKWHAWRENDRRQIEGDDYKPAPEPDLLVFRGICDIAADKGDDDWREIAARNAVAALFNYIKLERQRVLLPPKA